MSFFYVDFSRDSGALELANSTHRPIYKLERSDRPASKRKERGASQTICPLFPHAIQSRDAVPDLHAGSPQWGQKLFSQAQQPVAFISCIIVCHGKDIQSMSGTQMQPCNCKNSAALQNSGCPLWHTFEGTKMAL